MTTKASPLRDARPVDASSGHKQASEKTSEDGRKIALTKQQDRMKKRAAEVVAKGPPRSGSEEPGSTKAVIISPDALDPKSPDWAAAAILLHAMEVDLAVRISSGAWPQPEEYKALHAEHNKLFNAMHREDESRLCERCGKPFWIQTGRLGSDRFCSDTCSAPMRQPKRQKKHGGKSKAEAESNRLMARLSAHMKKHKLCPGPGCGDYDSIQGAIESANVSVEVAETISLRDGGRRMRPPPSDE